MTKRILSIIPARGGSKGLPRKNILDLAGKPLMAWTIGASLKSKYITKTVVSSDDKEILDISIEYGAKVVKRPDDLSNDSATSESVVKHAIDYLKSIGDVFDIIILLQPTSPLRDSKDIDGAFEAMFNSDATAVISTCEFDNKILKAFVESPDGFLRGISNNEYPFMRRQDLPTVHMSNGAIYIIDVNIFNKNLSLITDRTVCYVMPANKSFDVDSESDLLSIEKLIKSN
jgi:CMP-N-acetylneuraminic acid synthetase